MAEEARTYSQRTFTMHNGHVMPVKLDDWYWQHYDTLLAAAGNLAAEAEKEIFQTCYEVSKDFAKERGLDAAAAFTHVLGYWIQENVKRYDLDPSFQSA